VTSRTAPRATRSISDAEFHIRLENDDVASVAAADMKEAMMDEAIPWRTFRWYFGQCHYSGAYWAATEQAHVIHESRLELSRVLLADFDPDVTHIVAQPFLMKAIVDGARRRHIPDYFLASSDPPAVVDVKPHDRLDDPKVIDTFAWVRDVVESMGWRFEIAIEPPQTLLENVRFLAGYRRQPYVSAAALDELRSLDLVGMTFGDALRQGKGPEPLIRSALLHMLWSHELSADLSEALTAQTILTDGRKK
jgi:hypothetical protein